MPSSFEPTEQEHPIEQNNFSLYVLSNQGELKPRKEPRVVNDLNGGTAVFIDFVAAPGEEFRLFVRHDSPVDASADISLEGGSLGKWTIARESKAWHNIASDFLFKFQDSYDRQSEVFEPSKFEIRFQYLSRVAEGRDQGILVPTVVCEPFLEDGPGWVQPSDELMQSRFETVEDDPFLTFFISFHPPPATNSPLLTSSEPTTPTSLLTTSSLPTTSTVSTTSASTTSTSSTSTSVTSTLFTMSTLSTVTTTPTPSSPLLTSSPPTPPSLSVLRQPAEDPEPAPGPASTLPPKCGPATSLTSPASISQMSDDELQEALSEYGKSSLLLPPRLTPGLRGKLSIEDFCRRYELPEDIPPLLGQIGVKDAHGLSSKRLSDLRDKGMAPRSIKMLQLAIILFSSESVS
ncbi:hypothetical protein EDB84DRAFT_1030254 [Lactarius hengduanensis]|nr:hypothetical protein EDB84DRAFT_1030254 [Lactarius hengduanensis]